MARIPQAKIIEASRFYRFCRHPLEPSQLVLTEEQKQKLIGLNVDQYFSSALSNYSSR